jgi:Amt family ammonium transporter
MVWGGGWLAYVPVAGVTPLMGGALDFAGGTVVHISSGISALVCALVLKPRVGYGKTPMPPHSLVISVIGACLLWVGWFGFNGGSALAANALASSAFATTHFAAAAAALGWILMEWMKTRKPTVLGGISGAVAGLVVITPASGFTTPMWGLVMGFLGGVVCMLACTKLKNMFNYDDSLDAFGVHGVGGTLGALLTGVFAVAAINTKPGLVDGNPGQVTFQAIATATTWVMAGLGTFILLKVVGAIVGLRVSESDEIEGLDHSQHGESGYILGEPEGTLSAMPHGAPSPLGSTAALKSVKAPG